MSFQVSASFGSGSNKRRVKSKKFRTRRKAQQFADATNRDRPGSNARVTDI